MIHIDDDARAIYKEAMKLYEDKFDDEFPILEYKGFKNGTLTKAAALELLEIVKTSIKSDKKVEQKNTNIVY
ncbi:hypothetical protein [Companilactobacillus nodensis]|uniref:Uncharacterized protein n=1 Tax=Companilactobacillus nodensis DSM 19682 = JCM 14932 = NBRC 107160 TaxID=1423775 RepID=A0A0R1K9S4_9LACO|nr:hypothetical protein [Companilactobacillus nodensis]KRK80220.1 hypothetical protein FD03_GL002609 [Companilactobacillus nodensis DSM 19682 = JCM 14932 = NBRC 107160]